tara:strand:- start:129 stop:497 length:369 start_codon:yes stop_codon:yes gene_type:complete
LDSSHKEFKPIISSLSARGVAPESPIGFSMTLKCPSEKAADAIKSHLQENGISSPILVNLKFDKKRGAKGHFGNKKYIDLHISSGPIEFKNLDDEGYYLLIGFISSIAGNYNSEVKSSGLIL